MSSFHECSIWKHFLSIDGVRFNLDGPDEFHYLPLVRLKPQEMEDRNEVNLLLIEQLL